MARPSNNAREMGYLRSFWDEVREMEADYKGVVLLQSNPSPRPGIWIFRISFTPFLDQGDFALGSAAVQIEFPNATDRTLAGTLWYLALQLLSLVEQAESARKRGQKQA